MRYRVLVMLLLSSLLLPVVSALAQDMCAVSLGHVTGAYNGQIPISNDEVTFSIRITNLSQVYGVVGINNGFEISGSDPAVTWNVTDTGALQIMYDIFDLVFAFSFHSVDGSGADTIGVRGCTMMGMPLPGGYSDTAYWISLTVTDPANAGHQICLDSSWFPPSGAWMWTYGSGAGSFPPLWDGPHCFNLYNCCEGIRGNVDCDPTGENDIADLVYLVAYIFGGGRAPMDIATADFDESGQIDITDLIFLIEYMFTGGPAPPDCPQAFRMAGGQVPISSSCGTT